MVDVLTFFSDVLADLKRAGKLLQTPVDSPKKSRGWARHRRISVGDQQPKRTNCPMLWRRSVDLLDSESEDEPAASVSVISSFQRQAVPPLISELTSRWQHSANAMTLAESNQHDELSTLEVVLLLLTIIKHIVYEDIRSTEETSTCTNLLPSIANIFRDIVYWLTLSTDCQTKKTFIDEDLIVIGRCLVRVLFLMLLRIGEKNNGLTWLRYCKNIEETMDCMSESLDVLSHDLKRRLLLMDYVMCSWLYAEGILLRHHANVIVVGTVCRTIELTTRRRGLDLTKCVLLKLTEGNGSLDSNNSRLGGLVNLIKHIVGVCRLLKLMRSRYIHCCTCSRRTHRHCNIAGRHSIYRHHHDALGIAMHSDKLRLPDASMSSDWMSSYCTSTNSCIVSSLAIFLLGVFHNVLLDTQVRLYLLDVFEKGIVTCCCLPVDLLVGAFIDVSQTCVDCQKLRRQSVSVLVSVLLSDCGGNAALDHCSTCDGSVLALTRAGRNLTGTSENGCEMADASAVCRWQCVSRFTELVCSDDSALTLHIVSQAARLASNGSEALKQWLYCTFFMPSLVTAVHQLTGRSYSDCYMLSAVLSVDIVPSTVKLCLSALSAILFSATMLRHFISTHGIEIICKLADINSTRQSALSLLERLINVENSDTEQQHATKTLVGVNSHSNDDVVSVDALNAYVQLLFLDWKDVSWNENIHEHLRSSVCQVGQILDLWYVACRLFPCNGLFRQQFVALSGPQLAYALLIAASEIFLAVDCGLSAENIRMVVFCGRQGEQQTHVQERSLLRLIHCNLSICLRCSNQDIGIPREVKTDL